MSGARRRLFKLVLVLPVLALAGEAGTRALERWDYTRDARFMKRRDHFRMLASLHAGIYEVPSARMRPLSRLDGTRLDGSPYVVRINARGFRAPEFEEEPAAGRARILCCGESTTFEGSTTETTYPALLAKMLAPRAVEPLNLGISGATSEVTRERFVSEYVRFKPAVVVALHGINDVGGLHLPRFRQGSVLFFLARSRLLRPLVPLRPGDAEYRDVVRATTIANLEAVRAAAAERGIRLVLSTFASPDPARLSAEERAFMDHDWAVNCARLDGTTFADYRVLIELVNDELRAYARAKSLPIAPLAEELAQDGAAPFEDVCHFTDAGRERQAAAIATTVASVLDGN